MQGTDGALQLDLLNLLARGGLPSGPVAQSVRLALASPAPEARLLALRMLTERTGEPLATKELEKHLGDRSPRVRLAAAEVLAKRGDTEPEPLVATLLDLAARDPDLAVREETGTILRQMA